MGLPFLIPPRLYLPGKVGPSARPNKSIAVSARSIIVQNVLTPTLVGIILFDRHSISDMH